MRANVSFNIPLTILASGLIWLLAACGGIHTEPAGTADVVLQHQSADIRAELDTRPCPDGVDNDLWTELKAELLRVVTEHGTAKAVSAPPAGEENISSDLVVVEDGAGGVDLSWSYRNVGDYDQNSEANIADLTMIATHFNAAIGSANWEVARLADGDANGEVNVSDITPLGINFLNQISKYNIYGSQNPADWPVAHDSPDGPGASLLGEATFANSEVNELGERVFTAHVTGHPAGAVYWVRQVDSSGATGSPSSMGVIRTLSLEIDPDSASQPISGAGTPNNPFIVLRGTSYDMELEHDTTGEVTADAGTSYTMTGDVNDATVSPAGVLAVSGFAIFRFSVRGTYNAEESNTLHFRPLSGLNLTPNAILNGNPVTGQPPLTVNFDATGSTDMDGTIEKYEWDWDGDGSGPWDADSGTTPTATFEYSAEGTYTAWVRVTDNGGAMGLASIGITVESGQGNWDVGTVDAGDRKGSYSSLAVVSERPAICYFDAAELDLNYVRATDADGTSWAAPVTVDSAGDVGRGACLVFVSNRPAISYYDNTNGTLKYVRSTDPDGIGWGTPMVLDDTLPFEMQTSMAVVGTRPAISYHHTADSDLMFVRALDATGTTWGDPAVIDGGVDTGYFPSLAVVNFNPAVGYQDRQNRDLMFVRALDSNGDFWDTPMTADTDGDVGGFPSLMVANGYPAMCYTDSGNSLKWIWAMQSDGSTWGTPLVVDPIGGGDTSMVKVNNYPAIAYTDVTNADLKYVLATSIEGHTWGAPVSIDVAGEVGYTPSLAVVNGAPAIGYYDGTNRHLKYARLN